MPEFGIAIGKTAFVLRRNQGGEVCQGEPLIYPLIFLNCTFPGADMALEARARLNTRASTVCRFHN